MKGDTGLLKVSWNNHNGAFIHSLHDCLIREFYCDATLICDSKRIKVHRLVLAACSSYFKEIFDSILNAHPFIVLNDIGLLELEALIDYMYKGKATIFENRLPKLIKAADYLKIKGLAVADEETSLPVKISKDNQSNVPSSAYEEKQVPSETPAKIKNFKRKSADDSVNENHCRPTAVKMKKQKVQKYSKRASNVKTLSKKQQKTILPNAVTTHSNAGSKNKFLSPVVMQSNLPTEITDNTKMASDEHASPENDEELPLEKDVTSSSTRLSVLSDRDSSQLNISEELNGNSQVDQEYPHKCPDCTFRAKYKSGLTAHMKTHFGGVFTKPFKCGHCEFSTDKKILLQIHMKCHKVEKPFKCKKCPFRASLNISLKKHQEICKGEVGKISSTSYATSSTAKILNHESSQFSPEAEDLNSTNEMSQDTAITGTSLNIVNSTATSDELTDLLDSRGASCSSPLVGQTRKKICTPNELLKTDYFRCRFCSFKTSQEALLVNHVVSNHDWSTC